MTSEEMRKQIDELKDALHKQRLMENMDEQSKNLAYFVRSIFNSFYEVGFPHDDAWELTKIWCVRNFGSK